MSKRIFIKQCREILRIDLDFILIFFRIIVTIDHRFQPGLIHLCSVCLFILGLNRIPKASQMVCNPVTYLNRTNDFSLDFLPLFIPLKRIDSQSGLNCHIKPSPILEADIDSCLCLFNRPPTLFPDQEFYCHISSLFCRFCKYRNLKIFPHIFPTSDKFS